MFRTDSKSDERNPRAPSSVNSTFLAIWRGAVLSCRWSL